MYFLKKRVKSFAKLYTPKQVALKLMLIHGKKKCDPVSESCRICNLVPPGAIPINI